MLNSMSNYEKKELLDTQAKKEIKTIYFEQKQADLLHFLSNEIAMIGGPQNCRARYLVDVGVIKLQQELSITQHSILNDYIHGVISVLLFENMKDFSKDDALPEECPPLILLENNFDILYLGARSQLLLKLVENDAFAYDIDNEGKLIRLVANFKGGGVQKISAETKTVELSSHAGISLGPHTEAPYNCSFKSKAGMSPSPSSLILSAKWNPKLEPTSVIPILPILKKIGIENTLALTSNYFNFTRSDSFSNIQDNFQQSHGAIIDFDERQGFSIRFNSYRFSIDKNAPLMIKKAYREFCDAVDKAQPYQYPVTKESAIIINNYRVLHCRDIIKDNRRLLVRLFGVSNKAEPTIISGNPLILKG